METKLTPVGIKGLRTGDLVTWGTQSFIYEVIDVDTDYGEVRVVGPRYCLQGKQATEVSITSSFKVHAETAEFHRVDLEPEPEPEQPAECGGGNPKTAFGLAKPALSVVPPIAMFHLGEAMRDGMAKYGLMNWRGNKVDASVYYDAAMRHLMSWWDGEERATDSGKHHLAHAMACLAIVLDAQSNGNLNDDRPEAGNLPAFIKANTKEINK